MTSAVKFRANAGSNTVRQSEMRRNGALLSAPRCRAGGRHADRGAAGVGIDTAAVVVPTARDEAPHGVAPTAAAIWRHVGRHGNEAGKCRTMRRTERSIQTATL